MELVLCKIKADFNGAFSTFFYTKESKCSYISACQAKMSDGTVGICLIAIKPTRITEGVN
jgi:hypothetical protein